MRALPLLLTVLLAGCAGDEPPFSPVAQVEYSAVGRDPFWMVTIGDDRIVLTLGAAGAEDGKGRLVSHDFPRVLPRTTSGVTRWQAGEGTEVITIEARPGPCPGSRGMRYRDSVTVSLSGRQLSGCGGRILHRGGRS